MRSIALAAVAAIFSATAVVVPPAFAQAQLRTTIDAETMFKVRTTQAIDVKTADGLIFTGTVEEDVLDRNGDVAIPEGATVELMARKSGEEMTLDLESVTVNGRRYAVLADPSTVGTSGRVESGARTIGANRDTAVYVGGGALLGTIIGAITGGGEGAAIGAAVGAGAGAATQIVTKGKSVYLPAESLVTFRLARRLTVDVEDTGFDRDSRHYHRDYGR
ncbi:MAG TPA: hypothetical protein VFO21_25375 [Vicinamibacterales bacterium]|jgi:hypothetical protein|nr:hypothetical protein [Vicinamibacterales bacterium]